MVLPAVIVPKRSSYVSRGLRTSRYWVQQQRGED